MKKGFTLIELLVVIAIIGILAALLLPNILQSTEKTASLATQNLITHMKTPMEEYRKEHPKGLYPESSAEQPDNSGTKNLVQEIKKYYQFSDKELTSVNAGQDPEMADGWGQAMRYKPWRGKKDKTNARNESTYDMWSSGPDMDFNADEDNVGNWSEKLQ